VNRSDAVVFETDIDAALAAGDLGRAEAVAQDYCRTADGDARAAYLAARVALDAGRLGQAVERLTPLLVVADQLPAGMSSRVRLFAAEALARLGRGHEARPLLERVPAAALDADPLLHLRALRVRLWAGEVGRLGIELAACSRRLEERGDMANLALLACEEGRAWDRVGDLTRAGQCWLRAERLLAPPARRDAPDAIRADVLLQLGRLDHLRGHLAAALERYEAALACALPGPQDLELELRRLLVRLDLGQWGAVRAAAGRLLADWPPERLPEELRPLAAMIQGLLDCSTPDGAADEFAAYQAAARGDTAAARALYKRAFAANPSPERRARLALAVGLLALGDADRTDALAWLGQAEYLARSLGLPEVLIQTLQARGQVAAEEGGDDALARALFEEVVLLTEVQAGQLPGPEVLSYRGQRASVLRYLLRAACRRGDAAKAFHYQELERGRLLLDLLRTAPLRPRAVSLFDHPEVAERERELAACEAGLRDLPPGAEGAERRRALLRRREEAQLWRDQLFEEYLCDRGRGADAVLPAVPDLADVRRALPPGGLYVAATLVDDELYLLTAGREEAPRVIPGPGSGRALSDDLATLRGCLEGQLARYRGGLPIGRAERAELDRRLDELGRGPLGLALDEALKARPRRLYWVPDGPLHGLPLHALRRDGRYLVEDYETVWTFGGALFVHQAHTRGRVRRRFGPTLVVTEAPKVLPEAAREGRGVAASFLWSRTLHGQAATRAALRPWLARARAAHFACHAEFDGEHPLASAVTLPSGETLGALEWLEEPVGGLPLLTLSACRSAQVAPLAGSEVFGLVTGLLGGGARAVLAGLWPVADREVVPLMWRFYRRRLTADLATALAVAQRETLASGDSSPLFWAAFALFGDAAALPPPGPVGRWLARWRQARHARRYSG
jgi:tetratricopeptide (TPR) repeat protein